MVGVRADQDRGGDGPDAWRRLKARGDRFGEFVELAVVVGEELRLLEHRLGKTASLTSCDVGRTHVVSSESPRCDLSQLCVGERVSGLNSEINRPSQGVEGVAVRSALLIDDRSGGQENPQGQTIAACSRPGEALDISPQDAAGGSFCVNRVGLAGAVDRTSEVRERSGESCFAVCEAWNSLMHSLVR